MALSQKAKQAKTNKKTQKRKSQLKQKSKLSDEVGFILKSTTPEIAKKFIVSAVNNAKSLGFMPHPDYHAIKEILFDVNETIYSNLTFQFG